MKVKVCIVYNENHQQLLEIQNVFKKYGKQQVLSDICLAINQGEIVGLVGPNGAGKSTLMKIISGLIINYQGRVKLNGIEIGKLRTNKKVIGCMIENPGFNPDDTGYENLLFCSRLSGNYSKEEVDRVVDLLELSYAMDIKVRKYSLGMKQRLGLCQAVIGKPQLLILDEPTNGLDPSIIPVIRQFIKAQAREKDMGIMISSHILSEIEAICSSVVFLKEGVIIKRIGLDIEEVNNLYVIETDMPQKLFNFLESLGEEAVIDGNRIIVKLSDKKSSEILVSIISNGITINSMYSKVDNLEVKYKGIMGGTN